MKSKPAINGTFALTHTISGRVTRTCPYGVFVSNYNAREKITKRNKTKPASKRASILSKERRRKIVELVQRDGRVVVRDLGRRFATSLITIRKDLEHLHQSGLIHRAHGGALPVEAAALRDPTLQEKERLHRREEMRIATAAARLTRPGGNYPRFWHDKHGGRARHQAYSKSHCDNQCGEHRGGTGRNWGRGDPHRRRTAQEFIFAGGTASRRFTSPGQRFRRSLRTDDPESAGSSGEPGDDRECQDKGGCV